MRFYGSLIVVNNIDESRMFYEDLLGQKTAFDFGENVMFESGLSLQTKESWLRFVRMEENEIKVRSNNFELFFEEEDFVGFLRRLRTFAVEYVHNEVEYPWGQRVIRFYDPDLHIIEVGESMKSVIRRFLAEGVSIEETAMKTQHPVEFVKACMEG